MPPKGIVNSSQLEKELIRVFANAIMFNPLPSDERGFGPSLKLNRQNPVDSSASPGAASDSSQSDDGNIIADARDFYKFVVETVNDYRDIEDERLENAQVEATITAELRAGSVGMSSTVGEDGPGALEETDRDGMVTSRKRRRVRDSDIGSTPH